MEILQSLHSSWIHDTYFSLYKPIHLGEKSGGNVQIPNPGTFMGLTTLMLGLVFGDSAYKIAQ